MILKCLHCGHLNTDLEKKEYREVLHRGKKTGMKVRVCNECNSGALMSIIEVIRHTLNGIGL